MKRILNISEILVYYDYPEIFTAYDEVGTHYICLLISIDGERIKYISTTISTKRLTSFINGKIDFINSLLESGCNTPTRSAAILYPKQC